MTEIARTRRRDRALVHGTLSTVATRVIAVLASFVTLGIAARVLTTPEFGLVTILVSIWMIFTMFDLGVNGAMATRVARSHARDNSGEIRAYVHQALLALGLIGSLLAIGGVAGAMLLPWHDWIGGDLTASTVARSVAITFAAAGAALPAAVGPGALTAMQRFTASKACIATSGISTVIAAGAVAPLRPSPELFLLAVLGSPAVVTAGFTSWVALRLLRETPQARPIVTDSLRDWITASGWFALYTIAITIGIGSGTVIVGAALGPVDAGVFGVANRLCSPIITVVAASAVLLRPGLTEAITRGDLAWVRSRYLRGIGAVAMTSAVISGALVIAGPQIAELWVGRELTPARSLFAWTAAFGTSVAITTAIGVLVMAVEWVRAAAGVAVCAAIVSITASIVLAKAMGAEGAAAGGLLGCLGILLPGLALIARKIVNSLEVVAAHARS